VVANQLAGHIDLIDRCGRFGYSLSDRSVRLSDRPVGRSLGRTDQSVRRSERVNASSDWSDRPVGPTGRSDDRNRVNAQSDRSETKKLVLVLYIWCFVVKHGLVTLVVIMILNDTATFQVLFIVSLFCAWNITVEISSGIHLLKC